MKQTILSQHIVAKLDGFDRKKFRHPLSPLVVPPHTLGRIALPACGRFVLNLALSVTDG